MSPLTESVIKELVLEIEKKYHCTERLFEDERSFKSVVIDRR